MSEITPEMRLEYLKLNTRLVLKYGRELRCECCGWRTTDPHDLSLCGPDVPHASRTDEWLEFARPLESESRRKELAVLCFDCHPKFGLRRCDHRSALRDLDFTYEP